MYYKPRYIVKICSVILRSRGVLLGILGKGVPPGSPNPDPILNQKMSFSTPVYRPGIGRNYVIIT